MLKFQTRLFRFPSKNLNIIVPMLVLGQSLGLCRRRRAPHSILGWWTRSNQIYNNRSSVATCLILMKKEAAWHPRRRRKGTSGGRWTEGSVGRGGTVRRCGPSRRTCAAWWCWARRGATAAARAACAWRWPPTCCRAAAAPPTPPSLPSTSTTSRYTRHRSQRARYCPVRPTWFAEIGFYLLAATVFYSRQTFFNPYICLGWENLRSKC